MALTTVSSDRLSTNVKTSNLGSELSKKVGEIKNLVINGNMKVHQRAQSVTGISSGYATADRFYLRRNVSSTFNSNVTNGVLTLNNPSTSTGFDVRHGIEWDDIFYGKTMTVSFNATAAVGGVDLTVEVMDGSIANTVATVAAHLTGTTTDVQDLVVTPVSGTRYEVTVDIPADADVSFTPDILRLRFGNASAYASQTFTLSKVQFEFGSVATEFEDRSFSQELALCKRYYQKSYSYPVVPGTASVNSGMITGSVSDARTNRMDLGTRFEVEMRTTPTMTIHRPFSGGTGQLENFGSGNGTSAGNGRTFTMRGLGRKGFAGFTLDSDTGGTLGYHYQADAEV